MGKRAVPTKPVKPRAPLAALTLIFMIRQSLPLFLVLTPLVARAQTPTAPPIVIASGAQIQIPVPATSDKVRLQVLVGGSTSVLDDERANVQNGVAVARLEADPGTYDVRVVSGDKARTPLGFSRRFFIPGFKREAGRWLFNGSPVVYAGQNPAPTTSFLPNLRRDKKTRLPVVIPTNAPLKWETVRVNLPVDATLNANDLRAQLTAALTNGTKVAVEVALIRTDTLGLSKGYKDSPGFLTPVEVDRVRSNWQIVRQMATQINPDAALVTVADRIYLDGILSVQQSVTSSTDAVNVVVHESDGSYVNLIKIARRNAEEAPNFDLPVFAQFLSAPSPSDELQAFQSGASGLIVPEGTSNLVIDILNRQSARLSGLVTLEDVGLLARDFDRFAPVLRRAGRVPLLARLPGQGSGEKKSDDKIAESLFVSFDSSTDDATLVKIERAAKVGATIYCEGALPSPLWKRWSEITKLQIAPAEAKTQTLSLDDPWFWGTINDQNFDVTQTLALTVSPSVSAKIKEVKGEARETVARPIAHFNGDPNGIMLCPVSKGRIIWAPFQVTSNLPLLSVTLSRGRVAVGSLLYDKDIAPTDRLMADPAQMSSGIQTAYYAAVAGAMQPALVSFEATRGDASGVSVALRATRLDPDDPKSVSSTLVAFFNSSNAPVDLQASVRSDGAYVLDLESDQPIAAKVRDFSTRMALTIPANGFRWIVVAKDAKTWADVGKGSVRAQLK
jgi:hypothetical protein